MTEIKNHFIVGLILGLLTLPISFATGLIWAYGITFVGANLAFIGKEFYDRYKPQPTGFDKVDLFCDYLGWFGGVIVAFWIVGLIHIIL